MEKVLEEIMYYLRKILKREDIEEDTQLMTSGMLDSLGIVSLLNYIEETYGVDLSGDDFDIENFHTAKRIAEMVSKHI